MKYKLTLITSALLLSVSNAQVFEMEKPASAPVHEQISLEKEQEEVLFIQEENSQEEPVYAESFSTIIQKKKYDTIEQWLNNGASVNQQLYAGNTMIQLSAMHKDKRLLDIALKYKANFLSVNQQGESALYWAAYGNDVSYLQSLKDGIDKKQWDQIVTKMSKTQRNPLHNHILYSGNTQIIDFLLNEKIDINQPDINKQTPLHYAAASRKWDILFYLVSKGGSLMSEDKDGQTVEKYFLDRADVFSMIKYYPFVSKSAQNYIEIKVSTSNQLKQELEKVSGHSLTDKKI